MNQGRIWCVVNPTVGLPLFLGSVALTSLAVHTAVMTHTNWMSTYWQGRAARVAVNGVPQANAAAQNAGFAMTVTPVTPANAASPASFVITVSPTVAGKMLTASAAPVHTASAN